MIKSRRYLPLRSKTNAFVYGMILCGIVNIWGNFVANEHLSYTIQAHRYSCVLWSFWIIFISLSGWFVFMFMRLLYRSYELHPKLKDLSEDKKYVICNWVLLLVATPILSICLYATYFGSTYFDAVKQACTTDPSAKGMVLSWICTCGIGLVIASLVLEKAITDLWLTEYKNHRKILVLAVVITSINIIINVFGLQRYRLGRCTFTVLISVLHFYCVGKLLFYKIHKCIRGDDEYAQRFVQSYMAWDANMYTIKELSASPALMKNFMEFCIESGPKTFYYDEDKRKFLSPKNMMILYNDINRWKNVTYYQNTNRFIEMTQLLQSCAHSYVTTKVEPPKDGWIMKDMFDDVLEELIEDFQLGWGEEYLKKFNKNTKGYEFSTSIILEGSNDGESSITRDILESKTPHSRFITSERIVK